MGEVEQAAVVGGQPGVRLAGVNAAEQFLQARPVSESAEKDRVGLHPAQQILAQGTQADGGIGRVFRRQHPAILGVHQKEQAVQQGEGGFLHGVGVGGGKGGIKGGNQLGIDAVKYGDFQGFGNGLHIVGGAGQRAVQKAIAVVADDKGIAVKEQAKPAAGLPAGIADALRQADFQPGVLRAVELAVGAGAGGAVKPPGIAVGQDAPLDAAGGGLPELPQIFLHLAVGAASAAGAAVQADAGGFGLGDGEGVRRGAAAAGCGIPVGGGAEQHIVGPVRGVGDDLLGEIAPAQGVQYRPDQGVLDLGLVGGAGAVAESAVGLAQILPEVRQQLGADLLVLGGRRQDGFQVGLAEQGVGHRAGSSVACLGRVCCHRGLTAVNNRRPALYPRRQCCTIA